MVTRRSTLAWCLGLAALAAAPLRAEQSDTAARPDATPATLIGHVTDSAGVGLPGAEITLYQMERLHVVTGDSGEFRFAGIPPGTRVFNVRRLGFEAASFTAVLKPG